MTTRQPEWKLIDNLGDWGDPVGSGGFFVYVDTTGVYDPEAEVFEPYFEDGEDFGHAYRFSLERCTYINGILSDNQFHPEHPAWWDYNSREGEDKLRDIAQAVDMEKDELTAMFCSEDPRKRAWAYREVGVYFGYDNLDSYPLKLTEEEANERYAEEIEWIHKVNRHEIIVER